MKIFLDARKLGDGGIGRFILNLLNGLQANNFFLNNQFIIIASSKGLGILNTSFNSKDSSALPFKVMLDETPKYGFLEYFVLPLKYRNVIGECDWFISPHYTLPFFIPSKVKKLVVVHDLIQVFYPENILHKFLAPLIIKSSALRADKIASVSEHSAKKISEYFKIQVSVIPNSLYSNSNESLVAEKNYELQKQNLSFPKKKNILFIGDDRGHKRLDLFIDFFGRLSSVSEEFEAVVVSKLRKVRENSPEGIKFIQELTDPELSLLLNNSYCLVSTSREEGFCLPLIEAAAHDLPIICTDLDFAHEILGSDAWFFEDGSVEDLFRVFSVMHNSSLERQNKSKSLHNATKKYSIENQANKFIELLS